MPYLRKQNRKYPRASVFARMSLNQREMLCFRYVLSQRKDLIDHFECSVNYKDKTFELFNNIFYMSGTRSLINQQTVPGGGGERRSRLLRNAGDK